MPLRDLYAEVGPAHRRPGTHLVVVLPAYNEGATVAKVIRQIRDHLDFDGKVEVVVVDDGSTDDTAQAAQAASAKVVRHRRNEGLGVAVATGVEAAVRDGADIVVTMDSDGQFRGEHVRELIAPILAGQAEMVIGSRYLRPDFVPPETPWWKIAMSNALCRIVSHVIWGKRLTDVTCGFRAYSRSAAIRLNFLTRFTYTVESVIDAAAKGLAIAEVPVRCRGVREHGKSRMTTNFIRYLREIGLIVLRRMRDSRPLLFFFSLAVFFILIAVFLTGLVGVLWPDHGHFMKRENAILMTFLSVTIVAFMTSVSFLADQILTVLRYLHTVMRMARVNQYDMDEVKRSLHVGVVPVPRYEPVAANGNGVHGEPADREPVAGQPQPVATSVPNFP